MRINKEKRKLLKSVTKNGATLFTGHDYPQQLIKIFDMNTNGNNKLYKYRVGSELDIENLNNDQLWFANPSDYNDPFDNLLSVKFERLLKKIENELLYNQLETTKGDSKPISILTIIDIMENEPNDLMDIFKLLKSYINDDDFTEMINIILVNKEKYKRYIEYLNQDIDYIKIKQELKCYKSNVSNNTEKNIYKMLRIIIKTSFEFFNPFIICCFGTTHNNRLMWAHYADYHKGFCIEYDFEEVRNQPIIGKHLWPIIYTMQRPALPSPSIDNKSKFELLKKMAFGGTKMNGE